MVSHREAEQIHRVPNVLWAQTAGYAQTNRDIMHRKLLTIIEKGTKKQDTPNQAPDKLHSKHLKTLLYSCDFISKVYTFQSGLYEYYLYVAMLLPCTHGKYRCFDLSLAPVECCDKYLFFSYTVLTAT